MKHIFETVVYDGASKVWRILNINTGTVYSMEFETYGEAVTCSMASEPRSGGPVKFVGLRESARWKIGTGVGLISYYRKNVKPGKSFKPSKNKP